MSKNLAHPLDIKLRKLERAMYELQISVSFDGYHMVVTDNETGTSAFYRDIDSSSEQSEMPGFSECKLVIED